MSTPSTPNGPVRIGFVGLSAGGWASGAIAPSLLDPEVRKQFKVVAISTTNAESAAASAKKYSEYFGHDVKAYHGDVEQILSDPDVDLLAIAVKPNYHRSIAEKAIAHGKPFFLEWQAGKGVEDTLELARLAHEKGVKSLVGLQGRQTNVIKKLKKLFEAGKVGRLLSTNVNLLIPRSMGIFAPNIIASYAHVVEKNSKVTLVSSVLAHFLEIFLQTLGPLSRVSASGTILFPTVAVVDDVTHEPTGKTLPNQYPDHITVTGVLRDSGAWVTITIRLGHPSGPGRTELLWEIDGEDGTIKVDTRPVGSILSAHDPEHIYLNGEKLPWITAEDGEAFESPVPFIKSAWLEFSKGKENGGNFMDIHDAAKHRQVLEAIETSLFDGGRWIDL
ncbi:hypothetical protein D9611_005226 [Ephemerocybe angulata]|uniref:Gfo/Idh/MocA-like oxidoreductase N-terminal domain-containing protein n=1 Tax=Ephemerocybe angulata TaxID=980116 RepID=A0A8H5FDQ1_9AGAR|nr:hypothetical protein D9611_005226 [Tulosesus angulatus]